MDDWRNRERRPDGRKSINYKNKQAVPGKKKKKRKSVQLKVYKRVAKLINVGLTLVALSPHSHQCDACCNVGYFTGLQTKLPYPYSLLYLLSLKSVCSHNVV